MEIKNNFLTITICIFDSGTFIHCIQRSFAFMNRRRLLKTSQDILSPRWSPARHRHPPHSGALCRLARCGSTTGTVILVEGDSNGAQSLVGYHHWPVLCPPLVATGSRLSKNSGSTIFRDTWGIPGHLVQVFSRMCWKWLSNMLFSVTGSCAEF